MNAHRRRFAPVVLIAPWLATRAGPAAGQASAPSAGAPLGDLAALRAIAVDALQFARSGDLRRPRARVEDLEAHWRQAASTMPSLSPRKRQTVDTAIDRVERELRFWRARNTDSAAALRRLVDLIDESS